MAPRHVKTQKVDPSKAPVCFQRGRELLETTVEACDHERWSAAGVTAVHAAISLTDALLIQERGLRCTSPQHMDLVDLLGTELPDVPDVKAAQKHLRHILSEKNRVEYEARVVSEKDARNMLQHLQRFADWVNRQRTERPAS